MARRFLLQSPLLYCVERKAAWQNKTHTLGADIAQNRILRGFLEAFSDLSHLFYGAIEYQRYYAKLKHPHQTSFQPNDFLVAQTRHAIK